MDNNSALAILSNPEFRQEMNKGHKVLRSLKNKFVHQIQNYQWAEFLSSKVINSHKNERIGDKIRNIFAKAG